MRVTTQFQKLVITNTDEAAPGLNLHNSQLLPGQGKAIANSFEKAIAFPLSRAFRIRYFHKVTHSFSFRSLKFTPSISICSYTLSKQSALIKTNQSSFPSSRCEVLAKKVAGM